MNWLNLVAGLICGGILGNLYGRWITKQLFSVRLYKICMKLSDQTVEEFTRVATSMTDPITSEDMQRYHELRRRHK